MMNICIGLAFSAGVCIAIQAAMNAQLGKLLHNSLIATSYAFLSSFLLVSLLVLYLGGSKQIFSDQSTMLVSLSKNMSTVPWYLWLSFIFSVIGVGSFYFLIPKMGVGNMMSYALTGQILMAMLISHFGLFDSPVKIMSLDKLIGTILLVIAIVLINKE
ncbi:DMT family transporter [Colwellia sp. D2M02]|uniref:DMT family transporter n=1 Tax=Colwellia sp. D2M02 TaxID=2841562 RepID=UPI0020902079|nr:DMT family transporter [Colwellia sp. D2M02]